MKISLTLYLICFAFLFSNAQNVRPYLAIIKTSEGKQKGILHKVDSVNVFLQNNGIIIKVPVENIASVQIRRTKKAFKGVNLIKIGSEEEYNLDRSGNLVDKWGNEAPSLEEELGVTFMSVIATGIASGLAAPIHAINPNLAKFKFNSDLLRNKNRLEQLSYYSVYYQANPNVLAELKKIKEISKQFKP